MKKNTVSTATSLLKKQLDDFFKTEKADTKELLYRISLLLFQSEMPKTDVYDLYHIIDSDTINRLINHYDGAYIKLPSKKEWRECLIMVIAYYFKYIKKMEWKDIKRTLNIPDDELKVNDSISIGLKLKGFIFKIRKEFRDTIKKLDDKEIIKAFKDFFVEDEAEKNGKIKQNRKK